MWESKSLSGRARRSILPKRRAITMPRTKSVIAMERPDFTSKKLGGFHLDPFHQLVPGVTWQVHLLTA